jgi:protease YdgD
MFKAEVVIIAATIFSSIFGNYGFIPQQTSLYSGLLTTQNIFGRDDRIPMKSQEYPWSTIGRVEVDKGNEDVDICSGTLIWKNLVITNAHCVLENENQGSVKPEAIKFSLNVVDDEALSEARVKAIWLGTKSPNTEREKDWAILQLDKPLGEKYGWMEFAFLDSIDERVSKFTMVGYSLDFPAENPAYTAGVHQGCTIRGEKNGYLLHDCDMTQGASGGPIFFLRDNGEAVIVAINAAQYIIPGGRQKTPMYTPRTANIAVMVSSWAEAVSELRTQNR